MCDGKNNSTGLLLAMVAGAALGTLVGLLVAPNSGKKTRKKIKAKTRDLKEQAKHKYEEVADKVKEEYEHVSSAVSETVGHVADKVSDEVDKYKDEIKAKSGEGVQAVKEAIKNQREE
ncbi:MAG: YtxH domain-containing protein [Sphingobacterium sp.]|uniref:YtxH domain-containing protein n=1 Tax=Sphingobacterium sp. TaxID=341027 RepID=UPI002826C2D7|nr:YtxH domain-containing protein [Sphingobacterium sp.]MDR0265193.1 YtxH domain-containing protein [Sphingobacterium sp.]